MAKKQIYLFNEVTHASNYGVGTYIEQVKSFMRQPLSDVCFNIVHLDHGIDEFNIKEIDGTRYFYFPKNSNKHYYRNVTYILRLYLPVTTKEEVYFHFNFYQSIGLIDLLKNIYPNSVTIFTIHYLFWGFALKGDVDYFKKIIHKEEKDLTNVLEVSIVNSYRKDRELFRRIDRIVCLCQATYQLLLNEYLIAAHKLYVIPNCIEDEGILLEQNEKEQLKKKLSFAGDEKIILYVGRFDVLKGLDLLIRAFGLIVANDSLFRLVIVGDGDSEFLARYNEKELDGVTFTGRLGKKELYDYYKVADCGVLPSYYEQCSYTAIEMLMFGVPLITSTATGLKEMLDDSFDKFDLFLYKEDMGLSVRRLSELIIQYMHKTSSRQVYRKVFLDNYQKEDMTKNRLRLYGF